MALTPKMQLEVNVEGHVPLQNTVKLLANTLDEKVGISTELVSPNGLITIPAGANLEQVIGLLMIAIDPGEGQ